MEIGQRLRTLRQQKDLSLYRLSKLSGISYSFLHALEKGDRVPTVATLDRICTCLNMSLAEFFAFPQSPPEAPGVPGHYPSLQLEPWQAHRLRDFVASLQSPPMLTPDSPAGPAPVDRGSLTEMLLLSLVRTMDKGTPSRTGRVTELLVRVGLEAAGDLDSAYKRAWNLERTLRPTEYARLVVDLNERLGGTMEATRVDRNAVAFRVITWPFRRSIVHMPGMWTLLQAMIGGVAMRNFGYAKLSPPSPDGADHQPLTVYLRLTPESSAAEGWICPSRPPG